MEQKLSIGERHRPRETVDLRLKMSLPKVRLNISKNNYVFNSSALWNSLIGDVLEKDKPGDGGVIVRGSGENSDFCTTVPFVKHKLRNMLLCRQKDGDPTMWKPLNFSWEPEISDI